LNLKVKTKLIASSIYSLTLQPTLGRESEEPTSEWNQEKLAKEKKTKQKHGGLESVFLLRSCFPFFCAALFSSRAPSDTMDPMKSMQFNFPLNPTQPSRPKSNKARKKADNTVVDAHAPVTRTPPVHVPATHTPVVHAPAVRVPATHAPVVHAPAVHIPATHASTVYAPATHALATPVSAVQACSTSTNPAGLYKLDEGRPRKSPSCG
jgi:hypothetical protein